jgi:hypothetical protein
MNEITVAELIKLIQENLTISIDEANGQFGAGEGSIEIVGSVYFDGAAILGFKQSVPIEKRIVQRGIKSSDFGKDVT